MRHVDFCSKTKVAEFGNSRTVRFPGQEYIRRLDVSVNDAPLVEISETFAELEEDEASLVLHPFLPDELIEAATRTVLENKLCSRAVFEDMPAKDSHDVTLCAGQ